jgi:Uma2 family endonuclease
MVIKTAPFEANRLPTKPKINWELLPSEYILPDDPVENEQQPLLAAALTDALDAANLIKPEMLIVSNFGLVANIDQTIVVKAPDWLYVPQVYPKEIGRIRRSYTPYREGSAVAIVIEFLSDEDNHELSMRSVPPYGKLYFYEQILQVPVFITYDPYSQKLEVRMLQDGSYQVQPKNEHGQVWIPEINLFIGVWDGTRLQTTTTWLRWWDRNGNLLLWSFEKVEQERQRAEQERQRANVLAAKLKELGIDPNLLN